MTFGPPTGGPFRFRSASSADDSTNLLLQGGHAPGELGFGRAVALGAGARQAQGLVPAVLRIRSALKQVGLLKRGQQL